MVRVREQVMLAFALSLACAGVAEAEEKGSTAAPAPVAPGTWSTDYDAALKAAGESGRDLLLNFTGSDWCLPCMQLKKLVFRQQAFIDEAPKRFLCVTVDFPDDKSKQTVAELAQNRRLRERFDVATFPTIILADAKGRPYAKYNGIDRGTNPDAFLKQLDGYQQARKQRDKAFTAAADAKGAERAKLLHEGLTGMNVDLIMSAYLEEVKEIIALDADNAAGLKAKYEPLLELPRVMEELERIERSASDQAANLKQIDQLVAKFKPRGQALQEVHYARAMIVFRGGDKQAALPHLKEAIVAAPDTRRAKEIRNILLKLFEEK